MWNKSSPQNIIDKYKKRQQFLPIFISILALLLVIIGVVILILWMSGGGFSIDLFSKKPTPTSTLAPTPILSPTPSLMPTNTPTPTLLITPTPTGPFEYVVKQDDNCYNLALKFKADFEVLLAINSLPFNCPINPGQTILIPAPGQSMPTQTPINPSDFAKGTKYTYTVQSGDTLASIASKLYTTIADILALNKNKFTDQNNIPIGIQLIIRVNLVTPTPTFAPTSTRAS